MASKEELAILAAAAYEATDPNLMILPLYWDRVDGGKNDRFGYSFAVFHNTATNEIVIAFAGTDEKLTDFPLGKVCKTSSKP
jgi:hypothetical protein